MINLDFMPSRSIALYLVRLFLTRTFAVLLLLVMVLMALDLLGESGKILAVPGNGEAELWHYVSLRVPLLIQRFLPFAALLGTLIAFTALNQHSEVIAMKAAGLSAHQVLAPLIVASFALAVAAFAFNEGVAVNSARMVNAWNDNDYRPIRATSGVLSNVWVTTGDDLAHAAIASGRGPGLQLQGVTHLRPQWRRAAARGGCRSRRPGGRRLAAGECAQLRHRHERRASPEVGHGDARRDARPLHARQGQSRRARFRRSSRATSPISRPQGGRARRRAPACGTRSAAPCRSS